METSVLNMSPSAGIILLFVFLAVAILAVIIYILLSADRADKAKAKREKELQDIPVIKISHIGKSTKVTLPTGSIIFEETIPDDGPGEKAPDNPLEFTQRDFPELYAEYMDPTVSAIRKYEIIDEIIDYGYTLPLIPGLHKQYKEEIATLAATGNAAALENAEIPAQLDPKARKTKKGVVMRSTDALKINNDLRNSKLEKLEGESPADQPPLFNSDGLPAGETPQAGAENE